MDERHNYYLSGEKLPSVTTIVKLLDGQLMDGLLYSTKNGAIRRMASAISRGESLQAAMDEGWKADTSARDFGTRVHRLLQTGDYTDITGDEQRSVNAGLQFLSDYGITTTMQETKVAHGKYRYGGTVDFVGTRDGNVCVVDWKTSKKLKPKYHWQVAAYAMALEWLYDEPVQEGYVVRLPKDGTEDYEVQQTNLPIAWELFRELRYLYDLLKVNRRKYVQN